MEDRNDFTQEWPGRRVFIMLQDECVYVFDETGNAIHEPGSFVANGQQKLHGEDGFIADWEHGYYRLPVELPVPAAANGGADPIADGGAALLMLAEASGVGAVAAATPAAADAPAAAQEVAADCVTPAFDDFFAEGKRMQVACGEAPWRWNGALIGQRFTTVNAEAGVYIGYDDGDLGHANLASVREQHAAGKVLPMPNSIKSGLVDNDVNIPGALGFSYYQGQPVGVLLGQTPTPVLFDSEFLYHAHHLRPGVWPEPAARRTARKARASPTITQQDRLGMHTFRSGDLVEWTAGEDGEHAEAVVWMVIHRPAVEPAQARKALILFEQASSTFFIGGWPSWRRISKDGVPAAEFNVDNNDQAKSVSPQEWGVMESSWKEATELDCINSATKLEKAALKAVPPPAIQVARDAEQSRAQQKANAAAKKAAARKAAAAAAAAAAAMEADGDSDEDEEPPPPRRTRKLPPHDPPRRDRPPPDPRPRALPPPDQPPRDCDPPPSPRQRPPPHEQSPSPPRSVQQLKRLISGLKTAQAVPNQEPAAKAARAQELDGAEYDLAERVRKCKKYGHW